MQIKYVTFSRLISSVKIHPNLLKLLYFSHNLISSKFEAADEIMAKVQDQFGEVNVDLNTRNLSWEMFHTLSVNIGPGAYLTTA